MKLWTVQALNRYNFVEKEATTRLECEARAIRNAWKRIYPKAIAFSRNVKLMPEDRKVDITQTEIQGKLIYNAPQSNKNAPLSPV